MWKVENVKDAGRSQSSPNPCPGGGRKSGLSVAVRVTIQIEDGAIFRSAVCAAMTKQNRIMIYGPKEDGT